MPDDDISVIQTGDEVPPLSAGTRRDFLSRLTALGLAIPGATAALTARSQSTPNGRDTSGRTATATQQPCAREVHNPDSTPLPPAKEFVLVQSEFYVGAPTNGIHPFDYTKMLATLPDYVAFNGRPGQYQTDPIRVKRGDRVRFDVVVAGPTVPCAFHVVGEQFDTVYLGAPPVTPFTVSRRTTWPRAEG